MVTFYLPNALRSLAGGKGEVAIEGIPSSVAEALEALWAECPGIRDRVIDEQGQIREHINVFVGNTNIRDTANLQTPVPDGAEITILPAISGGARR